MIQLLESGNYTLSETVNQTKILSLHNKTFAWVNAADIGEILVTSHNAYKVDCILSKGAYRVYKVKNEPALTDLVHLELLVGEGVWQGYLLPHGLPTDEKKRNRIIPTNELITKNTR